MATRRDFLKGTLAGTGVLGFPAIIPATAWGANPPSERITMGAIGIGRMGGGDLRSFLQFEDVRVIAVCDVQETARQRAKNLVDAKYGDKACATHTDFRELLARKDIDAVLIATGERWHPLIDMEAARQGKHMYSEKPMAVCVEQAKAARAAVKRAGVRYQFGAQQRSSYYFRFACELVRNGRIGQLQRIVIGSSGGDEGNIMPPEVPKPAPPGMDWDMWLGQAPWAPYSELRTSVTWLRIGDYGLGNLCGGWGIHDIDIAQWVNNSDNTTPITTEGTGTLYKDIRDTICSYNIEHTYANGVKIQFMDLRTARQRVPQFQNAPMNSIALIGTEGWIWVSRRGMHTQPESLMRTVFGPNDIRVIKSDDHRRNLIDAIKTGGPTISPVDIGANAEMICQMGEIAVRLQRKLHWDPVKEEFKDDEQANRRLSRPMRSPWRMHVPGEKA